MKNYIKTALNYFQKDYFYNFLVVYRIYTINLYTYIYDFLDYFYRENFLCKQYSLTLFLYLSMSIYYIYLSYLKDLKKLEHNKHSYINFFNFDVHFTDL